MGVLIKNALTVFEDRLEKASILTVNGRIVDTRYEGGDAGQQVIDADGLLAVPGFVEVHTHGCGGYDFMDGTEEAYAAMAACYLRHGTTSLCPTAVACSHEAMVDLFATYRRLQHAYTVDFLGLHLEGPFLSPAMCGAQKVAYIRSPGADDIAAIEANADIIALITAAPEVEGVQPMARRLTDKGIALSVGHSAATAAQVKEAVEAGFTGVTHLYCSTTANRKVGQQVVAGIVEAAFLHDEISVELIGDGCHIPKETMQAMLKIKGDDRVRLTGDSMRVAGTDATEGYLGEKIPANRVIIEDGVAKLPDRSSFAGSIATGDMIFRNAAANYGIPLVSLCKMMSLNPARFVGAAARKGSIAVGKDADILLFDQEYRLKTVLCGDTVTYIS